MLKKILKKLMHRQETEYGYLIPDGQVADLIEEMKNQPKEKSFAEFMREKHFCRESLKKLSIYFLVLFITVTFILSCNKPMEISRVSLGKIVSASVIPTSFNEWVKIQITTEKCFVVIYSLPVVLIRVEAFQVNYNNGRSYFTWEGHDRMYKI